MKNGKWILIQLFLDINPDISGLLSILILIQLFLDNFPKQDKNPEITGFLSRNSWIIVSSEKLVHMDKYPAISGYISSYFWINIQLFLDKYPVQIWWNFRHTQKSSVSWKRFTLEKNWKKQKMLRINKS